ncbi:phosphate signaling complex protein PhoU [Magnetospirillum gryphiswaldense]|uniref:Phosphate-specific transport system accessory protein PhoU n=2 Tax=Magnetospirillum gryphiswaldense TaxID=55518 RepID=V6EXE9_MAGGM|nr:phosphate signaling complex protein PhoU [Magnetospirillum gryphiswaldense]AVM74147.1 Phosphate-specific transport system accessory protein PhoU [Magnetospirillum gryphiswaldense MSR-1]AVM78050.1 Phosphate-specific transport system accessory protein PhoU [Magnetospirillum gryphiswaldense]CAM77090.1 Phosphate transport system protein PhoU [Magnetospirillum gryphiswaldense MSR-1]CDK97777.1 Phosphate transport system protein phoU [Magnetospirillum gryphiswaldense MSR-1 v2]
MSDHTVKSYDEELAHLTNIIARMGGMAEAQFASALQALSKRDSDLAARVVAGDTRVDELEHEVQQFTVRLLALRQPVASDLRHIVAALKIGSELERVADYAANVAKRSLVLNQLPPVKPVAAVLHLAHLVQEILKDILDAYIERDVEKAIRVWNRDEEVDDLYTGLFRELITYMMEDPRTITACTHLMFMAKNIERIGDHATNIAETLHFLVVGTPIKGERPKGNTVDTE